MTATERARCDSTSIPDRRGNIVPEPFLTAPMTDEQRKAVALAYFTRMDSGRDFVKLFADNAYVCFPKHKPAHGIKHIQDLFSDIAVRIARMAHHAPYFNWVVAGDVVVVEGFTSGVLVDGTSWQGAYDLGGRFCNVFEIRDGLIQRLNVYLDPDYTTADRERYPWLDA
jgi:hypothetical protein